MITLTPSNIMFIVGILGTMFTVYHYFRNPQINIDKKQALDDLDRKRKDELIESRIKWERESNDKKFCELSERLKDAFLLASNHTNTVDTKVDKLIESCNDMAKQVVSLSTIINERIPKK